MSMAILAAITVLLLVGSSTAISPKTVLILSSGLTLPIVGLSISGIPLDVISIVLLAYIGVSGITLLILGGESSGSSSTTLPFVWAVVGIALVSGIPINFVNISKSVTMALSDTFDVIPVIIGYFSVALLVFESFSSIGKANASSDKSLTSPG